MAVALECIYSCERDDQLSLCYDILECLPQRGYGSDTHTQRHAQSRTKSNSTCLLLITDLYLDYADCDERMINHHLICSNTLVLNRPPLSFHLFTSLSGPNYVPVSLRFHLSFPPPCLSFPNSDSKEPSVGPVTVYTVFPTSSSVAHFYFIRQEGLSFKFPMRLCGNVARLKETE